MLYRDDEINKRIMTMQHSLDGRSLDIKAKDENVLAAKHGGAPPGAAFGGAAPGLPPLSKTKIFVGRLLDEVEPEDLRQYFEQYGSVVDVFMPTVHATGKRKNVGFVEFSSAESCSQVSRLQLPRNAYSFRTMPLTLTSSASFPTHHQYPALTGTALFPHRVLLSGAERAKAQH